MTYGWSPEITAHVHQWWNDGLSSSAIALRIGCSRNAVIGRVNRDRETFHLSWHSTKDGQKPKEARKPRKASSVPVAIHHPATDPTVPRPPRKPRKPRPKPEPAPPKPVVGTFHILDLGDRQCRFATSSSGDQHLFCGGATALGSSWCPDHALRIFQPMVKR